MTKNAERREKFRKIGEAISALRPGDPGIGDYYTGRESCFLPANGASTDPALGRMPGAPQFKTPKWIRTIK